MFTNLVAMFVKNVWKAIIHFAKTQCSEAAKTTTRVRFTICPLIGQIYFIRVFDWLTEMIFSHVKISYFYVYLNTIFLSGQKLNVLQYVLWLVKYISYVVFDWLTKIIFSHVQISYFLRVFKYDFSQWPKTTRFTICSLIGQIYFIRGFWLANENDIFTRKNVVFFYVCLNSIFLSGQKLYITLMFMK